MTRSKNSPSFKRMAINTVVITRQTFANGQESGSWATIGTYKATAFYPLDPDTKMRFALESPVEYLRTFINDIAANGAVLEGDRCTHGSIVYLVKAVGGWTGVISEFVEVIVEQDKTGI